MGIEEREIKIPTTPEKVFDRLFMSSDFVLVTTPQCSEPLFSAMTNLLDKERLNWLVPLNSFSSRKLFLGRLDSVDQLITPLVFKKSRFQGQSTGLGNFQPGSCANEIKTNLLLQAVVKRLLACDELSPPNGFESLSVSVESPIGILVDNIV